MRSVGSRIFNRELAVNPVCLYLDEDTIKSALVKALRNADLDVITVIDAGMLGLTVGSFFQLRADKGSEKSTQLKV